MEDKTLIWQGCASGSRKECQCKTNINCCSISVSSPASPALAPPLTPLGTLLSPTHPVERLECSAPNLLQVLTAQDFKGSLQEQTQQARALWGCAPWTLAEQCIKLSHEELEPELQQAQEWCRRYAHQLHSQKDTLQIKEALPETDLQLFTGRKKGLLPRVQLQGGSQSTMGAENCKAVYVCSDCVQQCSRQQAWTMHYPVSIGLRRWVSCLAIMSVTASGARPYLGMSSWLLLAHVLADIGA